MRNTHRTWWGFFLLLGALLVHVYFDLGSSPEHKINQSARLIARTK